MQFYRKSAEDVLEFAQSSMQGLSDDQVKQLLAREGYNEIENEEKVPVWKLFLETFRDPMVVVLLIAAGIQLVLGEIVESFIIFLVLTR